MTDWTTDRATYTSDPFYLRRDVLNPIQEDIEEGGGGGTGTGGRTVTFSQAAGGPAITGGSPKFIAPFAADIQTIRLAVVGGPAGSPLTVEFLNNAVVYAVLQIDDGSEATVSSTSGLPSVVAGDELTVDATDVGSGVPAQGITAQVDLG